VARALGCSDGQVWTLGLTVAVAVALVTATLPAGLRPKGDTVLLPPPPPAAVTGAAPQIAPPVAVPPAASVALPPPALGVLPPLPLPGITPAPPVRVASTPAPRPGSSASALPAPAGPRRLTVVSSGWYDADPEATARKQLTPPAELPVSADRGTRAATSLLRLSGNAPLLELAIDTTPGRSAGTAALELCRNATSTWQGADAEPASAAPPVTADCVRGTLAGDRWTFLLDGVGAPDAATGFTLRAVVTSAATETFSVTFFREPPS
jgi:hypothetical protein